MMLLFQKEDLVYPFFELMDGFVFTFSHCLVPMIRFSLDLLPYSSKISVCYRFVGLVKYNFDNVGVGYSFNRKIGYYILDLTSFSLGKLGSAIIFRF